MNTKKSEVKATSNKGTMLRFLGAVVDDIKDTNLAERITYTINKATEDIKSILKSDLFELVTEAQAALTVQTAPIENQAKPKIVEEEEIEDEEVAVEPEEEEETPKKSSKKSKGKKKPTLKKKVEENTPLSKKSELPIAKIFPEVIEHEDLGKLVAVPNQFHTMADVMNAMEEGKTLYLACYWSPRQLKEYDYAGTRLVKNVKAFDHNLDLLTPVVPCSTMPRVWAMSIYTEAMFMFDGEDVFEPVEETDSNGDKFRIRVSCGMEFEVYMPEDEVAE